MILGLGCGGRDRVRHGDLGEKRGTSWGGRVRLASHKTSLSKGTRLWEANDLPCGERMCVAFGRGSCV